MVRKILQPLYTCWVLLTFCVTILLCLPFFFVFGLSGSRSGRRAVYYLIRAWSVVWLAMIGMPVTLSGRRPPKGRYVVVANHISYLDSFVIFPAIPGYFRPLGKKEISKIPVVGFIYKQIVIMVDRSDVHSRAKSLRLLWRVLHHEGHIIIFPEGTFNETAQPLKEFYDGAFRLAINTQTAIFPMILPDTVNRWNYKGWWRLWPGKNRVVYLEPVAVKGMTMADLPELKNRVYNAMQEALLQHPAQ